MISDFKNKDGLWQQSKFIDGKQLQTRMGNLWYGMRARSTRGSYQQRLNKCYEGVTNTFESFHVFGEWCVSQKGYNESGWCLDKDILVKNSRVYSPQTCCFVPEEINYLLVSCRSVRGDLPVGVTKSSSDKFIARCRDFDGKRIHLGSFQTPDAAFLAYKSFKEAVIKKIADKWFSSIGQNVYTALYDYKVDEDD